MFVAEVKHHDSAQDQLTPISTLQDIISFHYLCFTNPWCISHQISQTSTPPSYIIYHPILK